MINGEGEDVMATYYKRVKGKNYDGKLISKAERSVKGRGDGRISLNDAKALLKTVKDSSSYTDVEKATMRHIRDSYDFTPEADRWFRSQIRSWAATKAPARASVKKSAPKQAARKKKAAKMPTRARRAPGFEQEYIAPPSELIVREPVSGRASRSRRPAIVLLIMILVVLGLFLYPRSREWISGLIKSTPMTAENSAVKPLEQPVPPAAPETVQPEKKVAPPAQEKPAAPPKEEATLYVVQVHEGLVNIAEKELKDYRKWVEIYRLNSATIPNTLMLVPGQKLKMPEGWKVNR
jgi:hypothetical protein